MTIEEAQQNLVEQFDGLDDWMDRYAVIIDMGNTHSPIDEKLKTPDRLIEGCQSRVWLDATKDSEGHIKVTADSDALIVKESSPCSSMYFPAILLRKFSPPTSTSSTT